MSENTWRNPLGEPYLTELGGLIAERFIATGSPADGERQRRELQALDYLLPIVEALPWAPRAAILTEAREEATRVRQTTREQLHRREQPSWRMG